MTAIPYAPGEPQRYVVSSVRAAGPTLQELPDADAGLRVGNCAMKSLSRFVLNKHGRVFHLAGCARAGKSQPWAWAEPLSNSQIHEWIEPLGIRPCRRCDPLTNKIVADEFLESSLIQEGDALDRIRREAKIKIWTRAEGETQEAMLV